MSSRKRSFDKSTDEDNSKECKVKEDLSTSQTVGDDGLTSVVAAHYNTLGELGLEARNKSRIVRLKEKFQKCDQSFDIVSCQFSFHYCFESLQQAECMIRNAAECLKPGGFFIGTIPDANDIVMRQRKSGKSVFGNDVYKIQFNCDTDNIPLFGAQYDFYLEGVVNCPEFLVHFPTFIELAKKHKLKLVIKERFRDYYERHKESGKILLTRMKALETYPPSEGVELQGSKDEYRHADKYMKDHNITSCIGTISTSEWEAISLYLIFGFVKEGL